MKKLYFQRVGVAKNAQLTFYLPFQMLPVSEGETQPVDIEVGDIQCLCVRYAGVGETGIGKPIGTAGATSYELNGSEIVVHVAPVAEEGEIAILVNGKYGQVGLRAKIVAVVGGGTYTEVSLTPYVFSAIAGGGGGDYKTDIYMDGDGRVIVERLEDGSTMLLDEHENPIVKRNADGSTQYFDAYQSARLMIGAHGEVEVSYTEDDVVKTLKIAEAILARTQKRLLYNTAGETTIKDAEGNVLTHAQIYDMLMTSPDFVVLVRSDHAFHPNLVTPTQIAFTCSYLGVDGQISAERVNITSDNVVTYTSGKGLAFNNYGGIDFGQNCHANWLGALAHGVNCSTRQYSNGAHSEGLNCNANESQSHAEGSYCQTNGGTSHAEGNYCSTGSNGGSAHAEGSYTNANGAASHAEGYRTVTTEGGSHAQGCWNKVEGGQYAFMHGCGTSEADRKNAFLIAGDEVYMFGIGGYDGTNYGAEGVKSVQTVIRELQLKLVNF